MKTPVRSTSDRWRGVFKFWPSGQSSVSSVSKPRLSPSLRPKPFREAATRLSPSTGQPLRLTRFEENSTGMRRNVQFAATSAGLVAAGGSRDSPAHGARRRSEPNVHKAVRRSTSEPRRPTHGLTGSHANTPASAQRPIRPTPHAPQRHPPQQRSPARVHELTGGSLPGRLACDHPPLDGRRARQLLSNSGRPASLRPRAARRVYHLNAPRRTLRLN
jgi:hypothetical protein